MRRWFYWSFVFVALSALLMHLEYEIPFITSWLGYLPGDMVVRKGSHLFHLPLISSLLIGGIFTGFLKLVKR